MPAGIWANRFWNRDEFPAWHNLGINSLEPITALEALNRIGKYTVYKAPLTATVSDGEMLEVPYSIITCAPTKDRPEAITFGAPVSNDYELIDPEEACRIWDECVTQPIETLGVLKEGAELFISAKIKSIDVLGDQVDMFQVWDNPMYSNEAAVGVVTGYRPVCANTLAIGIATAQVKFTVVHIPGAKERMRKWLTETYQTSLLLADKAKETFEAMAKTEIRSEKACEYVKLVYADPPEPKQEWVGQFGLTFEEHMARYEDKLAVVEMVRDTVLGLFGGDGCALGTPATEGTVFGLYNSIAEFEDNRRGPAASTGISVLIGDRAATVRKAYRVLAAECKN